MQAQSAYVGNANKLQCILHLQQIFFSIEKKEWRRCFFSPEEDVLIGAIIMAMRHDECYSLANILEPRGAGWKVTLLSLK